MKNFNQSSNVPNSNWQVLGECKLSVQASMDAEIQTWLMEILHPLPLHTDFLNRILKSAHDSAAHAVHVDSLMKFDHIHLVIFVPQAFVSKQNTWGFFRIDKVGTPSSERSRSDHSVEFYLYPEG